MIYVVVLVREGVVNVPDAPEMPLGVEVQEPAKDDQVMMEVVLAAPYAIMDGDAETYMSGALDFGAAGTLPPHEARPEITDSTVKQPISTTRDLITVYFDMYISLK
jgi:hypothetical protein